MLNEKVAIITGAAGGIGSAAARLLGQHGAVLVLTDIRSKELQELSETMKESGMEVMAVEHDIREPESWRSLVGKVRKKYGKVDILINNAGVIQPGAAEEIPQDDVHHQVSVNFLGTVNGCRAVLPVMKEQGSGKIVNVASLGGIVPMPGEAVYSATKSAIRGYSLSLHAELRNSPVGITVVCPDSVDTPQLDYELQHDEAVLSFIGDPMKPEKVAKGILKAVRRKKPEVLVPSGMGVFCRIGMAFPKLYFSLLPMLEKIGSTTIKKRREKKKASK
ncbi:MAG: SDR family oxidoreductase [Candidatus Aminicenantes bacterium]|jgi:short-subunit dehydrogenase